MPPPPSREALITPAQNLSRTFAAPPSSSDSDPTGEMILSHFTTTPCPLAIEHGHPSLAPFLGRAFQARDGVARYFNLLASTLSYRDMVFEPEDDWVVDTQNASVSLRGRARFKWLSTGEEWDETFTWLLRMAREGEGTGEEFKVCEYKVWADTGAAFLAGRGEFARHVKESQDGGKDI